MVVWLPLKSQKTGSLLGRNTLESLSERCRFTEFDFFADLLRLGDFASKEMSTIQRMHSNDLSNVDWNGFTRTNKLSCRPQGANVLSR
jgi:hypothetical protein